MALSVMSVTESTSTTIAYCMWYTNVTPQQQCSAALSLPGAPEDQVTVIEAAAVVPLAKPQPEAVGALRPALLRAGAGARELSQVAGPLCCHVCKGDQAGLQQKWHQVGFSWCNKDTEYYN